MSGCGNYKSASALDADEYLDDHEDVQEGGALTRQAIVRVAGENLTHLSRREIKRLVDTVIEEMVEALIAGETVKLHDFGSFVVRDKGKRSGRNPRTGERVPIEPRRVVVFKASPKVKAAMNPKPKRKERPITKN
jgi:integration host factor subunit alpha